MPATTPPEITLELTGGSLTIRTAEAIYHITVAGGGGAQPAIAASPAPPALPEQQQAAPRLEEPAGPAPAPADDDWDSMDLPEDDPEQAPPPAAAGAPEDEEYFRELSHDMYREVGRLARRLSMSIRDVKVDKIDGLDPESAGEQLEQAKDQLESVVKMTENATLQIMDLGEQIQGAIDNARGIMQQISTTEGEDQGAAEPDPEAAQAKEELARVLETVSSYLGGLGQSPLSVLVEDAKALKEELGKAAEAPAEAPAAPAAPAEPAGPYYNFSLDLVFQTTYEMCTNETVKKHIKAMWDTGAAAFDPAKIEEGMNALVSGPPDEDNFLNLDLTGVLKVLFQASSEEKFKQVLKKMASTVDQIFLEPSLPLEAVPGEAPAPAAPPPPAPAPAPAGPSPEALAKLDSLISSLEAQASSAAPPPELPDDLAGLLDKATVQAGGAANVVKQELVDQLNEVMSVIFTSVNNIIEVLSFQDLSGQAIYRIVRLLTDFQVQLLAMVVSFGSKIKTKEEKRAVDTEQSEKMAQEEVDKALASIGVSEEEDAEAAGEPSKLDQDSVNSLLDDLGF